MKIDAFIPPTTPITYQSIFFAIEGMKGVGDADSLWQLSHKGCNVVCLPSHVSVAIAIQSFGDFLGFNPHLHVLCTDGCFYGNGMFRVAPRFETKDLEKIFRHNVFKMLLSKGKIVEGKAASMGQRPASKYSHRILRFPGSIQ